MTTTIAPAIMSWGPTQSVIYDDPLLGIDRHEIAVVGEKGESRPEPFFIGE